MQYFNMLMTTDTYNKEVKLFNLGRFFIERFKNLAVVYTSGYSPQCDNAVLAASNAHYLQKPYSPSALSRLVREILDQARVSEAHD